MAESEELPLAVGQFWIAELSFFFILNSQLSWEDFGRSRFVVCCAVSRGGTGEPLQYEISYQIIELLLSISFRTY